MAITSKYTIICDDVRKEDNGKILLLGVYPENIVVPQFPFKMPSLCFYELLASDTAGKWPLKFRMEKTDTRERIIEGEGQLEIEKAPSNGLTVFRFVDVTIKSAGTYQLVAEIGDQRLTVAQFEVTTPEALAELSRRSSAENAQV